MKRKKIFALLVGLSVQYVSATTKSDTVTPEEIQDACLLHYADHDTDGMFYEGVSADVWGDHNTCQPPSQYPFLINIGHACDGTMGSENIYCSVWPVGTDKADWAWTEAIGFGTFKTYRAYAEIP